MATKALLEKRTPDLQYIFSVHVYLFYFSFPCIIIYLILKKVCYRKNNLYSVHINVMKHGNKIKNRNRKCFGKKKQEKTNESRLFPPSPFCFCCCPKRRIDNIINEQQLKQQQQQTH